MALDKDKLKTDLKSDLESTIVSSFEGIESSLNDLLKGDDGGLRTAMVNIKNRVQAFNEEGHTAIEFMPFIQTTVSEEYAKAISTKLIESLVEDWAPKVAEAIAVAVSTRLDEFVKSANIIVPAGQHVYVPYVTPAAGASASETGSGSAYVNEASEPAIIT
jgi:hypothetical protein